MQLTQRIRLLKKRMRRLMRGRQVEHSAALRRARRESRNHLPSGLDRYGPDEEHGFDPIERAIDGRRYGEIAGNDFGSRGKRGVLGATRERAHGDVALQELVDEQPSDATRRTDDEDSSRAHGVKP